MLTIADYQRIAKTGVFRRIYQKVTYELTIVNVCMHIVNGAGEVVGTTFPAPLRQ